MTSSPNPAFQAAGSSMLPQSMGGTATQAYTAPIGALYMMLGHGATPAAPQPESQATNQGTPRAQAAAGGTVLGRNPTNTGQRTLLGQ